MIEKEPVYKGDFAYLCRRKKINKRMNQKYPSVLLENAVNELSSLPGVGRKTALRLALYMLRRDVGYTEGFASALLALRRDVKYCKVCHNICDVMYALSVSTASVIMRRSAWLRISRK